MGDHGNDGLRNMAAAANSGGGQRTQKAMGGAVEHAGGRKATPAGMAAVERIGFGSGLGCSWDVPHPDGPAAATQARTSGDSMRTRLAGIERSGRQRAGAARAVSSGRETAERLAGKRRVIRCEGSAAAASLALPARPRRRTQPGLELEPELRLRAPTRPAQHRPARPPRARRPPAQKAPTHTRRALGSQRMAPPAKRRPGEDPRSSRPPLCTRQHMPLPFFRPLLGPTRKSHVSPALASSLPPPARCCAFSPKGTSATLQLCALVRLPCDDPLEPASVPPPLRPLLPTARHSTVLPVFSLHHSSSAALLRRPPFRGLQSH